MKVKPKKLKPVEEIHIQAFNDRQCWGLFYLLEDDWDFRILGGDLAELMKNYETAISADFIQ